jgi:hypothetical protein
MDHDQVIKTLESLIPQGAKAGPENVLVKYASENNLAPAQLERVAQMYNVAMTINFMNKSASRGDTFQLIDTTKLMAKYTDHAPSKEAHVPDEWASWLAPDDTMNKAASSFSASMYEMPDIVAMAKGDAKSNFVETRVDTEYPSLTLASSWETFRKESFDKFEVDGVNRIIFEAEEEYRNCASEIQDLIQVKGASFKEMVHDVYLSSSEPVFGVMQKIAGYLSQTRCPGDLDATPPSLKKAPSLVRDRWGVVGVVEKAAAALETIKASKAYLDMYEKEATQTKPKSPPKGKSTDDEKENSRKPKGKPSGDEKETEESTSSMTTPYDRLLSDARAPQKDKKPAPEKPVPSLGDVAESGIAATRKMMDTDTYFGGLGSFDESLKKVFPTRTNTTQKVVDTSRNEAANITTLQRLLVTDPIISEADPNTVISLYNTLQKANPDIASDPNVLRFALREAIQYDAVPMHTYKDFVETDQKHWQAEKDRDQVVGQRYSI